MLSGMTMRSEPFTAAVPLLEPAAEVEQAESPPARAPSRATADWVGAIPFILCHVAVLGALWSGVTWKAVALCVALYAVRMFAVTGGYHRYFAHRAFETSRIFAFFLALLAETSAQKGVLWWAAHHRFHHKHSDDPMDLHSPRQRGFWYAHVGWMFSGNEETDYKRIPDFASRPELRWLNEHWLVPPVLLGVASFLTLGWSGLFVGFFLSTVLLWHGTFTINSLSHVIGKRRFATKDDSRNHWLLAMITLGEGWHNNHHHYMRSCRQGFYWWEIDVTYYVLRALSLVGIVWKIHEPPQRVLDAGRAADAAAKAG
jgi:stearoyl-CoA desaturase (delta-9 desaturase)